MFLIILRYIPAMIPKLFFQYLIIYILYFNALFLSVNKNIICSSFSNITTQNILVILLLLLTIFPNNFTLYSR